MWVSDLTYIRTLEGFSYLSLITDAFSRKIVGFSLYQTLEAIGCICALKMAIAGRTCDSPYFLIHHSDRGIQYCSAEYVGILNDENIAISMTQSGSPYDNALAERVNGIIKNECYPKWVYQNHKEAANAITRIIHTYNNKRPHAIFGEAYSTNQPEQRGMARLVAESLHGHVDGLQDLYLHSKVFNSPRPLTL
ncbi:integrase core domain-containing protein [Dyadobacter sp. CY107]|nr:integrase core domain-containing protein [Dyadobacter fanqingshengii]